MATKSAWIALVLTAASGALGETAPPVTTVSAPEKGWSIHDPNSTIAIFTIVLALVGGVQAFIARLQWKTYRAQTDVFTAQNRAYIFLKSFRLEPTSWVNGKPDSWQILATLANSGTTPPRDLRVELTKSVLSVADVNRFGFEPTYDAAERAFVGPQSSIEMPVTQVKDNLVGQKTLIWGWMEYTDVFPKSQRHRTEFCYDFGCGARVNLDTGSSRLIPELILHHRHNGMDDDCMHKPRPVSSKS